MTNKAYIVANEEQEREVLEQFETKGYVWTGEGKKPTEFVPSHIEHLVEFPYALLDDGELSWCYMSQLDNQKIVYDGRKEEQMSDKYVVSQEFMNELKEWKDTLDSNDYEDKPLVGWVNLKNLPETVSMWWGDDEVPDEENNNRLIAILRWVNGEDVFKVEKPKKWVVRSKGTDEYSEYRYVDLVDYAGITNIKFVVEIGNATKFDTKEEAESWANAHQEVIEVEE